MRRDREHCSARSEQSARGAMPDRGLVPAGGGARLRVMAACLLAVALTLGLSGLTLTAAAAPVFEEFGLGVLAGPVTPNCPALPCVVITRTTGFQASISGDHYSMVATHAGRVTSWSIDLATPSPAEVAYFDGAAHGPPRGGLVILRHIAAYHFRVIDASPVVGLTSYFGRTTQFALSRPLPVRKGDILALSVPTWAPALASGLGAGTAWRANRVSGACNDLFAQTALTTFGALTTSECVYSGSRLSYGARIRYGPF